MELSIVLSVAQVAALRSVFGAEVDIAAKAQAWVNDWLIQFERQAEETSKAKLVALRDAFVGMTAEDQQVVAGAFIAKAQPEQRDALMAVFQGAK